ncbi:F-box only protein 33 [Danaus plexippus]|uniref:F-box only protein 33 n=1 Tax=Danaus plexippus TaxID=13037 RepID=UPI002AB00ED3|nr:F-box only protein 33 [Danaus plexippus]
MSTTWDSLPLLPLRCVLQHLSTEDALAALSTCRHWRSAILLFEGHKEKLTLRIRQFEKTLFLTRLFRKHVRVIHVYIDNYGEDLDNFMNYVLPQFFEAQNLRELIFIGPSYIQQNPNESIAQINRITAESLVFKNLHSLQKLALMGCEMTNVKSDNGRYTNKHVEYYSRHLSFNTISSAADAILSRSNIDLMTCSNLQHLIVDYEQLSTSALQTVCVLRVTLSVTMGLRAGVLPVVDWTVAARARIRIALNVVSVNPEVFDVILHSVFVEGLHLVSLKAMFCKTLHTGVLQRAVRLYKSTLTELVWADAPYDSTEFFQRIIKQHADPEEMTMCNVNPLILLCWQCTHLKRLVVHGYWVWQYDLLGFVRLRNSSLEELDISAIYNRQSRFSTAICSENVVRVLTRDVQKPLESEFIDLVNSDTRFPWQPVPWEKLHPALRAAATTEEVAHYVTQEILKGPY